MLLVTCMCAHDSGMCAQLLAFVAEHTEAGEAKLAGNSVHVDAQFLRARMPRLHAHFHHRIVDVSTVAELAARWFPQQFRRAPRKQARPLPMQPCPRYMRTAVLLALTSLLSQASCPPNPHTSRMVLDLRMDSHTVA